MSKSLLRHTQDKIKRLFVGFTDESHGLGHIGRVVSYGREICKREGQKSGLVEMAAWLHDIGRAVEHIDNSAGLGHEVLSEKMARKWFQDDRHFAVLSAKEKGEILYAVKNHCDDSSRDYKSAVILRDADKLDLYGEKGLKRYKFFHIHDIHELICNIVVAVERSIRLKTAAAKKIWKERQLLRPLERYLKNFASGRVIKKKKALVAISGGVDSAVAAALLKKAGYEVTGAFMKCYSGAVPGRAAPCWIEDRREALRVAAKLGLKLLTFDFEKEYRRKVIDYLYKEYRVGRTPNPDVICNKYVKIPFLLEAAEKLGFDYIATGHYARLDRRAKSVKLLQAADKNKDQTYFLHQLRQKELSRLIFPLGALHKSEVRVLARQWGLPVADREESMGICFIGEVPMKEFLQKRIKPRCGSIIFNGKKVGEHEGLAFYTIGEKIGVAALYSMKDSSASPQNDNVKPFFVVDKDVKRNRLIVGHEDDSLLYKKRIQASGVNWLAGQPPKFPLSCEVRLRHRQSFQRAIVQRVREKIIVNLEEPQRAATPGQFVVFYMGRECLGGGTIT